MREQIDGVFTENTTTHVHVIEVFAQVRAGRGRGAKMVRRSEGTATVCEPCRQRLYSRADHVIKHRGGEGALARACVRCYKCGATRIYGLQIRLDGQRDF
jgi:NADH pyrophosphatase NudC (nudix superfamily)